MTTFNKTSFENICKAYGFIEKGNGLYTGRGSLVWGREVYVNYTEDAVKVTEHKWQYDCDGDCDFDTREVKTLRVADAIAYLATVMQW